MVQVVSNLPNCLHGNVPDYLGIVRVTNLPSDATAGEPGTLDPLGSIIPSDLADMNAVSLASGNDLGQTTTWATDAYVVLGDGTSAHWNGTTDLWTVGPAP